MQFDSLGKERSRELVELFSSTFSSSEGEEQGSLIGSLVANLCNGIDGADILCYGAQDAGNLVGAIFFTRLRFADDSLIYMLAPVAVSTGHQGTGVGKALITFGLSAIASKGAVVAITYGDPAYYGRVGFSALSESVIKAPVTLSMPIGWLGQSLAGKAILPRLDQPTCVGAFRSEAYW